MTRPRLISLALLATGAVCIAAGVFLVWGSGFALIALGAQLIAADLLVRS